MPGSFQLQGIRGPKGEAISFRFQGLWGKPSGQSKFVWAYFSCWFHPRAR